MLIILSFIFYILLCLWRLDWALMVLIFGLPSYLIRFHIFGIPSTLLEGMILISFAIFVLKNYQNIIERVKNRLNHKSKILNHKLHRYPFDIEIILLLVISWLAIIVAGVTSDALGIWKAYFFEPVLVYVLIFNIFWRRKEDNSKNSDGLNDKLQVTSYELQAGKILRPLTASAFFISAWAILQKMGIIFSPENFLPRVTGPFSYPNALGLYLGPLVLVLMGWLFAKIPNSKSQIYQKIFIGIVLAMSVTAIILARSEGALAGIGAAALVMAGFIVCNKIFKKPIFLKMGMIKIFIIMALAMCYPLIALNIYPRYYYPNFSNKYVNYALNKIMLKDLSGEIRKQQWRETWQMLASSPKRFIFGDGLSGYRAAIAPYHQDGIFYNFEHDPDFRRKIVWFDEKYKAEHWQPVEVYMYPHSLFLNFWSELGPAGALLFVWIILKFIYIIIANCKLQIANSESKNFNKYLSLGLLGAMIVIVIHGIVDAPYFKNDLAVMFWILLAPVGFLDLENKSEKLEK